MKRSLGSNEEVAVIRKGEIGGKGKESEILSYSHYWNNNKTRQVTNRGPSKGKVDSSRLGLQKITCD